MLYAVFGVFTTAVYYGIWWVLFESGIDYRVASAIGYGIGSFVNYGLQKWVTFKDRSGRRAVGPQLAVYWLIVAISLGLTVGLVWVGVDGGGLAEWLSVALASGVVLLFNFAAHKWITFNSAIWRRLDTDTP